jgi:8-oxo-dGTP pyrophosphatase MutT (NUDIX family)
MSEFIKHKEGKVENEPQEAAVVVVLDEQGRVLLLKRTDLDRSFTGWSLPGGKREKEDKDILTTVINELRQETGIEKSSADFQGEEEAGNKRLNYKVSVFQIVLSAKEKPSIVLSDEHDDFCWERPDIVLGSPEKFPLAGDMTRRILARLVGGESVNKQEKELKSAWPLPGSDIEVPEEKGHPGAFGAIRKFDRHTGVDLYAPEGQEVVVLESGTVVAIEDLFTGGEDTPKDARGEPIWLPTAAVLVEGNSGVLLYGEIKVDGVIKVGNTVEVGQKIGTVLRVLKPKPDGRPYNNPYNSPSMLHFERYVQGTTKSIVWNLDEPQPASLLDSTSVLLAAKKSK